MSYHVLDPEATGTVGPGAAWTHDASGARSQADPLRCEFAGWLGDDLVGVQPDFVVSGVLADALRASDLTGFELRQVIVTRCGEFVSYGGEFPDRWERLVPTGDVEAGGDFSGRNGMLLVSERALALLNDHRFAEAVLTARDETEEAVRFVRRQEEARATSQARINAERDAKGDAGVREADRITALVVSGSLAALEPPIMRTNAKRAIVGELTLAATALGGRVDDDATLAVLRLIDGPIEVDQRDTRYPTYRSVDRSVQVHLNRDVVSGVEFVMEPHWNAPEARYSRASHLIEGVGTFTREAVLERLGDPVSTKTTTGSRYIYDVYRLGRKRLLFYWDPVDQSPQIIIVGRKG